MQVYEVLCNDNVNDGMGTKQRVLVLRHEEDAIAYIEDQPDAFGRTRAWKDGCYGDWEIRPLEIVESLVDVPAANEYAQKRHIRAQALAKLTDEERLVLFGSETDTSSSVNPSAPMSTVWHVTPEEAKFLDLPKWPDKTT